MHDNKLREAVRMVTDRNGGRVYLPDDQETKMGRPVLDVLSDKHPPDGRATGGGLRRVRRRGARAPARMVL